MPRLNNFLTNYKLRVGGLGSPPPEEAEDAVGNVPLSGQIEGVTLPDLVETVIDWNNNSPMVEQIPTGIESMMIEVVSASRADWERLFGTQVSWTFTGGVRRTPTAEERYRYRIERWWVEGRVTAVRNTGQIQANQINTKTIRCYADKVHLDRQLTEEAGSVYRILEIDTTSDPPIFAINDGLQVSPHEEAADTRHLIAPAGGETLVVEGAVNLWDGIFL